MTAEHGHPRTPGCTPLSDWQAARTHPHTYPGSHPEGSFILADDRVQGIDWASASGSAAVGSPDLWRRATVGDTALDDLLAGRDLPTMMDRIPVLAYGGNRNPATLQLKLQHYGYLSPGRGVVLPVLTGVIRGFDVVAAGLSGQGYLYADLFRDDSTADTELSVHVLFLDPDQLRVMHDSEGVRAGLYDVAVLNGLVLDDLPTPFSLIEVMAYVARGPVFVSPTIGSALAFSAVRAVGRTLPEFDALEMLEHSLSAAGLLPEVARVVGASSDDSQAVISGELMKYLNGQWWFRQHTGQLRLIECERLHALIRRRLAETSQWVELGNRLGSRGTLLSTEDAYNTRRSASRERQASDRR